LVNDSSYKEFIQKKYSLIKINILTVPAFIPPSQDEFIGLPKQIELFRKSKKILLSSNASSLKLLNGVDLYGFDMLIELVYYLKKKNYDIGLIVCISKIDNHKYYQKMLNLIKKYEISDDILIYSDELPNGFEVWKISDLFLRPTSTDSEGISVKEALCLGTQVVASDVCKRPKEANLFKSRDMDSFKEVCIDLINNLQNVKYYENIAVEKITDLYKQL